MPAKRTRKVNTDPFIAHRPQSVDVAVGDGVFKLRTATLDQEARFLAVLDDLELGELIAPITSLMGDGGLSDNAGFISNFKEVGPQLWGAARKVLGKQFAPAVREACIALLDNELNHRILRDSKLAADEDIELGADGEFLGSRATRGHIKANLTLLQGVSVVKAAWDVNSYGDLLGNILTMGAGSAA